MFVLQKRRRPFLLPLFADGAALGANVVPRAVFDGIFVGFLEGTELGCCDGVNEGRSLGISLGMADGKSLGNRLGKVDGVIEGIPLGLFDGREDGL